jgi:RHH-type proline utilization regulon transcriptional repressor/proline dehydrogenase/delta 1-pyrroline-5-carboxylate dehydrogenase
MGSNMEDKIRQTGMKLYDVAEKSKPSLFKKDYWTGKVMDLSMKNEAFKQEMFRFVDVFPYLSKPESVARHIQEYFCRPEQDFPKTMRWGLSKVKPDSMVAKMAAKSIGKNIGAMGKQFITGETIDEAAKVMLKGRKKDGVAWTVKILKEAVTSTREEETFLEKQMELMERYSEIAKEWPALGTGAKGGRDWGFTPQVNISLMASCLYSQYLPKSCAMDYAIDRAKERLRPIYRKAVELDAYVLLDMEHLPARTFTLELFKSINDEPEFRDWPHKGIAYQAYMKDAEPLLADLLEWARKGGHDFGMRLIKGAFWDEEVVLANLYNYPIPVFTNKHRTDASYERCARTVLQNHRFHPTQMRFPQYPHRCICDRMRQGAQHPRRSARVSNAQRHGGKPPRSVEGTQSAPAPLFSGGGNRTRHGLPGAPPFGKHIQRIVFKTKFRQWCGQRRNAEKPGRACRREP